MFMQRLKADDRPDGCGFRYDYMGSAEFEYGATGKSRAILAKLQIDGDFTGKKVRLFTKWGVSTYGPVDVYVFGSKKTIASIGTPQKGAEFISGMIEDFIVIAYKENPRADNSNILGWMTVLTDQPLLIIRATPENIQRGNKFLQMFMDQIESFERDADKQLIYTFENGWTLKRENGPIVLPQNDGTPIEANGQWVLRDEKNNPVDRDKYFSDITERHQRRIGDPIATEN